MIGLIFGDTEFPKEIIKTVKKRKIKYLIIDLSKSKKFKKDRKSYSVSLRSTYILFSLTQFLYLVKPFS